MVVFIGIFAIGCLTFQADMESWIYQNWGSIRDASSVDFATFIADFQDSIVTLGFFSLTISIGLLISIVCVLFLVPFSLFLKSAISSFAIIFISFSSSTIAISFQTEETFEMWFQFDKGDAWISIFGMVISIIWTFVGFLGYCGSIRNQKQILSVYLVFMTITSLLMCALGLFLIIFSFNIEDEVSQKWEKISQYLAKNDMSVSISVFTENLDEVVKFAGLYALSFFIFNTIGIATSYYQFRRLFNQENK